MKFIFAMIVFVVMAAMPCFASTVFKDHEITSMAITKANGETVNLSAEMVVTPEAEETGLMYRTSMPKDSGMLFTFDAEDMRVFWMKNTVLPLDMLFMRKDGTIVSIHANAVPYDLTYIRSEAPANAVLEINGGRAAELGLKAGDVVHHTFFANKLAQNPPIH